MHFIKREIIKNCILKACFLLLGLLICLLANIDTVIITIIVIILILSILNDMVYIRKVNRYKNSNDKNYISDIEKTLQNTKLVYDGWYITDNYMFSVYKLKKVEYKYIEVVEGSFCIRSSHINSIGWKQTIYLNDGTKLKIKSTISSEDSEKFERIVKKSNPNVYFGTFDDYKRLQNIKMKKL